MTILLAVLWLGLLLQDAASASIEYPRPRSYLNTSSIVVTTRLPIRPAIPQSYVSTKKSSRGQSHTQSHLPSKSPSKSVSKSKSKSSPKSTLISTLEESQKLSGTLPPASNVVAVNTLQAGKPNAYPHYATTLPIAAGGEGITTTVPNTKIGVPHKISKLNYNPKYTNTSSTIRSSSCTVVPLGQPVTVFSILPNPKTVTITVGGTNSIPHRVPEFTPPVICPLLTELPFPYGPTTKLSITSLESTIILIGTDSPTQTTPETTTFITTSKNPVTVFTTPNLPVFPGPSETPKKTVNPDPTGVDIQDPPPPRFPDSPIITSPPILDGGTEINGDAPGRNVIQGISFDMSPGFAIISGTTYPFTEPTKTLTEGGVPILIGSPGLIFPDTTVAPPPQPTNVVILGGEVLSVVKSSLAVFGTSTITYGASTYTSNLNGETITFGTAITFDGTTLGGASNQGTQLGLIGGVSVTQVGQTIGVISATSFTIGPEAVPTTATIDGFTITANSDGLGLNGITLSNPFNPSTMVMTTNGMTYSQIGSSIVVVGGSTYTIGAGSVPTSAMFSGIIVSFGPGGLGVVATSTSTESTLTSDASTATSAAASETGQKNDGDTMLPVLGPLLSILAAQIILCMI